MNPGLEEGKNITREGVFCIQDRKKCFILQVLQISFFRNGLIKAHNDLSIFSASITCHISVLPMIRIASGPACHQGAPVLTGPRWHL
jgi:hypothetical protein